MTSDPLWSYLWCGGMVCTVLVIFTTTHLFVLPCSRERAAAAAGSAGAGAAGREVWRTKGSSYADLYTQNVVISMEEQESQQAQAAEAKAPKERPVWLTQSTVQGAYNENDILKAGQYHITTPLLLL